MLFNSIESISNAKNMQDKYDTQIDMLNSQIGQMSNDNVQLGEYVKGTTHDRDIYRRQTYDLLDSKQKLEAQNKSIVDKYKKSLIVHEKELREKTDEVLAEFEAKLILEKEKKALIAEREKMKDQIRKLKARKGKVDIAQKSCKNCTKDYIETENFNWSCRIHQGEWSGELWWMRQLQLKFSVSM